MLARGNDHFDDAAIAAETTLAFRKESLFQVALEAIEKNAGEDIPGDVEQQYTSVVVKEWAVPLLLVKVDDCNVFEILRDLSLAQHHLE
ncbi:unnamed protein product [Schistocephalus solidus]|uniref:Coatomer_WDAD domain-containing protein n=1 Tax=Schistocephalus solidus TaxID=70667 RepID=A0A183T3I3_SCHSO|nr:unnamed protein product [Schistocephalus solidus]